MKQTALLLTLLATIAGSASATSPFRSHRVVAFVPRGGVSGDEIPEVTDGAEGSAEETKISDDEDNDDEEDNEENGDKGKETQEADAECVGDVCSVRGGAQDTKSGNGISDEELYEEYDDADADADGGASSDEVFEEAFEELDDVDSAESYPEEEIEEEEVLEEPEDNDDIEDIGDIEDDEIVANAIEEEPKVAEEEIRADGSEVGDFGFGTEVIQHNTDDGDSSAFVDREELADAYDDDETALSTTAFRAGHTDDDDRASIDDVPDAAEAIQEYEQMGSDEPVEDEPDGEPKEESAVETTEGEKVESTEAGVQPATISNEVEKILIEECGFHKSELRGMKPEIANVIAEKRLRRPLEGIPPSWYEEKKKGSAVATIAKVLAAAVPVALGVLSVYGGVDIGKLLFSLKNHGALLIGEDQEEKAHNSKNELTIPGSEMSAVVDEVAESVADEESQKPTKGFLDGIPGLGAILRRGPALS